MKFQNYILWLFASFVIKNNAFLFGIKETKMWHYHNWISGSSSITYKIDKEKINSYEKFISNSSFNNSINDYRHFGAFINEVK